MSWDIMSRDKMSPDQYQQSENLQCDGCSAGVVSEMKLKGTYNQSINYNVKRCKFSTVMDVVPE